jgi:hypothetical protein
VRITEQAHDRTGGGRVGEDLIESAADGSWSGPSPGCPAIAGSTPATNEFPGSKVRDHAPPSRPSSRRSHRPGVAPQRPGSRS